MDKKILLIGETCSDVYVIGDVTRLCPESPSPIFVPISEYSTFGMASNVRVNIEASSNIQVEFLTQSTPIIKTRYIDKNSWYLLMRKDDNDKVPESEELTEEKFHSHLDSKSQRMSDFSAVVISSYNKGLISKAFVYFITQLAKMYGIPVFMDCKFDLGEWSKDVFVVKINKKEYGDNLKLNSNPEKFCKNLVVTRSADSTLWFNEDKKKEILAPYVEKVVDCAGAGDTQFAYLISKYLETGDLEEAIIYGNKAASYATSQRGVVTVKKEDIE